MTTLCISGAAGRMGKALIALAAADKKVSLACALEAPGHPQLGEDSGLAAGAGANGVPITDRFAGGVNAVIDFSSAEATAARLGLFAGAKAALVIGTTGLGAAFEKKIRAAARKVPVIYSPNMSRGVNLMFDVAAEVARRLGAGYDVEIVEAHHRFKADSPSGTALKLADAICKARGWRADKAVVNGRAGRVGARPPDQIGMHAVRAGDVVGEHTVIFAGPGERIELTHRAHSREAFAAGAIAAAKFLAGKKPGLYTMADVLKGGA